MVIGQKKSRTWVSYKMAGETVRFELNYIKESERLALVGTDAKENWVLDVFMVAVNNWHPDDFQDEKGNPLPCTDQAKKAFVDAHIPDAVNIVTRSMDINTFILDAVAAKKKFKILDDISQNGKIDETKQAAPGA